MLAAPRSNPTHFFHLLSCHFFHICALLSASQNFVLELLRFGAVYYCPVTPQANERAAPGLTAERLAAIEELRRKAIAVRSSLKFDEHASFNLDLSSEPVVHCDQA